MQFDQESLAAYSGRSVPEFHRSSLFIGSADAPPITFNAAHVTSRFDHVKSLVPNSHPVSLVHLCRQPSPKVAKIESENS